MYISFFLGVNPPIFLIPLNRVDMKKKTLPTFVHSLPEIIGVNY